MGPPRVRLRLLGDIDCLYVHKLFDAVDGKLPSVAAFLDAAEGKARIGAHGFVDEDATTLHPFGSDVPAARQIAGDDAAAEAKRRIVGRRARLIPAISGNGGGARTGGSFRITRHPPPRID